MYPGVCTQVVYPGYPALPCPYYPALPCLVYMLPNVTAVLAVYTGPGGLRCRSEPEPA